MPTRRQKMIELLEQGPLTVSELAELMRMRTRDVVEDLQHVQRSLRERKLVVQPARCTACGLVFSERTKLTAPSRCPRCRSERTTEPLLHVQ